MTAFTFAIFGERWLDEVVLQGSLANLAAGDQVHNGALPAGFGDCAVMELGVYVSGIVTFVADEEQLAVASFIVSGSPGAGSIVDIIGVDRWSRVQATQVGAYASPDPLVLWRQNELLEIAFMGVDTGTTSDLSVRVKVARVRPIEAPASPIQLVR